MQTSPFFFSLKTVTFYEKELKISDSNKSCSIRYASENLIVLPPKGNIEIENVIAQGNIVKEDLAKVIPPPEMEDIVSIIGGAPVNEDEAQIMSEGLATMAPGPITASLPRLPGLPVAPQMQQPLQGQIAPQDYAAAFPFDELGQLVASRRGQA